MCNVPNGSVRFDSGTTIWCVLLGKDQRAQRIDKISKRFDTLPTKLDLYFEVVFLRTAPEFIRGLKGILLA